MPLLQQLLLYAVAGLLAVQLLVTVAIGYLRSRNQQRAEADRVQGDLVACPECGTRNEAGYRFCRSCVGELPGADGRVTGGSGSASRSPF